MAGKYIALLGPFQPFHWAPKNIESPTMPERFISEAIKPLTETADTSRMAIGEPGLPQNLSGGVERSSLLPFYAHGVKSVNADMAVPKCMFESTGTRWQRILTEL
jgi:hypothetical protein